MSKAIFPVGDPSRRRALGGLGALLGSVLMAGCGQKKSRARAAARGIVVGGGFGGATCARFLQQLDPSLDVTLIEANTHYTACPFSNLVIGGQRRLNRQRFRYGALENAGIRVVHAMARDVDPVARRVTLEDGRALDYDRLVLAPGIDLRWDALPGYDQAAAERMPHAWKAGPQTTLLRRQLRAMDDGGTVVISAPENPFRCPPGPYERASLIAHYLKTHKPRAKLLILDAKDTFSKKTLFVDAWAQLYGDLLEWRGLSDGARVIEVDARTRRLRTDFDSVRAAVACVIPPQKAGFIADRAGVSNASGWCPIQPATFESTQQANVHVIGDAAIANAMPKSAFAANAQAKLCAAQIVRMLRGEAPLPTTLLNTCYSLVAPDYGISVAGVYRPSTRAWEEVAGAGGISARRAPTLAREQEARFAEDWFRVITTETFT